MNTQQKLLAWGMAESARQFAEADKERPRAEHEDNPFLLMDGQAMNAQKELMLRSGEIQAHAKLFRVSDKNICRMNQKNLYHFINLATRKSQTESFRDAVLYPLGDDSTPEATVREIKLTVAEIVEEAEEDPELIEAWHRAERREEEKQAAYARIREQAIVDSMWVHAHAA